MSYVPAQAVSVYLTGMTLGDNGRINMRFR